MAIFKLFSQRQDEIANGGKTDVYQYDQIPTHLREQLSQIAKDGIGLPIGFTGLGYGENPRWVEIERIYMRERGLGPLSRNGEAQGRVIEYMANCPTRDWLDLCELVCFAIVVTGEDDQHNFRQRYQVTARADETMEEINYRLRQAGVGYQFEGDELIRVDSQFIHAEVVKPAIKLLNLQGYEGPSEEFLAAHLHFRKGEYRQAVAMAANAFESMLKAICDEKGWEYKQGARISDLLKVARGHRLWPDYLDTSFDQLAATLQSGLPKIRDNDASHGQGAAVKQVPSYVAAYALHLAASKIVFIGNAANDLT